MRHRIKPFKAIIFDNTRYIEAAKRGKLPLPDFENRNTESQYWVWWPRESAAKGRGTGLDYDLVGKSGWDSAFNLTASYRRDSDIVRIWGTAQVNIYKSENKTKSDFLLSIEYHQQSKIQ